MWAILKRNSEGDEDTNLTHVESISSGHIKNANYIAFLESQFIAGIRIWRILSGFVAVQGNVLYMKQKKKRNDFRWQKNNTGLVNLQSKPITRKQLKMQMNNSQF